MGAFFMLKFQIKLSYGVFARRIIISASSFVHTCSDLLHDFGAIFVCMCVCYIRYYYYLNLNRIWMYVI